MHAGESYPASGLSVEITPLLLLYGVSACSLDESSSYTTLLELFWGEEEERARLACFFSLYGV